MRTRRFLDLFGLAILIIFSVTSPTSAQSSWEELAKELKRQQLPGDDRRSQQTEAWQSSWDEFVNQLQRLFNKKATELEIGKFFASKKVTWEGYLQSADSDQKQITIRMRNRRLTLPDGHFAEFMPIILFLETRQSVWDNVMRGAIFATDRFEATVEESSETFVQPVMVMGTTDVKGIEVYLKDPKILGRVSDQKQP